MLQPPMQGPYFSFGLAPVSATKIPAL